METRRKKDQRELTAVITRKVLAAGKLRAIKLWMWKVYLMSLFKTSKLSAATLLHAFPSRTCPTILTQKQAGNGKEEKAEAYHRDEPLGKITRVHQTYPQTAKERTIAQDSRQLRKKLRRHRVQDKYEAERLAAKSRWV